ncbi:MAG: TIGR04282 family arsenosugar biosynthesis glycosyltransferase [Candidatus Aquicultorales bacterium]
MGIVEKNIAIAIITKTPAPGRVKTRLSPPLEPDVVAALYACFVEDTIDKIDRLPGVCKYLALDLGKSRTERRPPLRIPASFSVLDQGEGDLGDRLAGISRRLLLEHPAVVLVGADSPDLPQEYLEQGLDLLQERDVVIGPAEDGGYYAIGMKTDASFLFEGVRWSTGRVFTQTMAKTSEAHLRVGLLPIWRDVDDCDDLRHLKDALKNRPREAPATSAFLEALIGF